MSGPTQGHWIIGRFCFDAGASEYFSLGMIAGLRLAQTHPEYAMAIAESLRRSESPAAQQCLGNFPKHYPWVEDAD